MSFFENLRSKLRSNQNLVFDMNEMNKQMEIEDDEVTNEIKNTVRKALDKIDKRECYNALKQYYLANEFFPKDHYIHLPRECSQPIETPKHRLQKRYRKYGRTIGGGVYLDNNDGLNDGHGNWRVYITSDYFDKIGETKK